MALAMRGEADRDALIRFVDTADVPASWRTGPLKVTIGGDPRPEPEEQPKKLRKGKPKG